MAEAEQTKVCPLCAETIKAKAKLCPFCRSKQVRYALWGWELLMVVPGVALVTIAIVVIAHFAPDDEGAGGRNFASHRNDLEVLNTSLESGAKSDYWMTGMVTNRGVYPWRVSELEVRFLDERGNLLDVCRADVKDPFVVLSRHENGFRVELGGLTFTNINVTRQVRVQTATDGDRLVKSD